jgi:uncharacterized membrane protein
MTAEPMTPLPTRRWDLIDIARGLAVVAMVIYHFSWDLSFLQLTAVNVVQDPGWRWFAKLIAGSFLVLTGIGLSLAHSAGFRRLAFLKRLAKIAGAAALITVATYIAFPQSFIFFGILHCIALSSLLALPVLRMRTWIVILAAAGCFVVPFAATAPALDAPWLDWLGLGSDVPVTNDYVPVFPWFGLVLIGIVVARLGTLRQLDRLAHWRAGTRPNRWLIWLGRHSLPIYLIHQPVLLAVLFGVLQLTGPSPAAQERPFVMQCEADCGSRGTDLNVCRATCGCVVQSLRKDGLWDRVMQNQVDDDARLRISRLAQSCLRTPPAVR